MAKDLLDGTFGIEDSVSYVQQQMQDNLYGTKRCSSPLGSNRAGCVLFSAQQASLFDCDFKSLASYIRLRLDGNRSRAFAVGSKFFLLTLIGFLDWTRQQTSMQDHAAEDWEKAINPNMSRPDESGDEDMDVAVTAMEDRDSITEVVAKGF